MTQHENEEVVLTHLEVAELRGMRARQEELPDRLPPLHLGAVVDLACTLWSWLSVDGTLPSATARWLERDALLRDAWQTLHGSSPFDDDDYGSHASGMFSARSAHDVGFIANRLQKALREIGLVRESDARGLGGAIGEMVDNVLLHSSRVESDPAPHAIAYHVGASGFSLVVGDVGRGLRASLAANPKWPLQGVLKWVKI